MAVVVKLKDGTEKTYEKATRIDRDGYADYVFTDDSGKVYGTLLREDVKGTEVR